jgi:hypothetical protein
MAFVEPMLLEQLLTHLFGNRVKYTSAHPALEFAIRPCGERVAVELSDRGPGIASADAERIFEHVQRGPIPASQAPDSAPTSDAPAATSTTDRLKEEAPRSGSSSRPHRRRPCRETSRDRPCPGPTTRVGALAFLLGWSNQCQPHRRERSSGKPAEGLCSTGGRVCRRILDVRRDSSFQAETRRMRVMVPSGACRAIRRFR